MAKNFADAVQKNPNGTNDKEVAKINAALIVGEENQIRRTFEIVIPEYGEKSKLLETLEQDFIVTTAQSYKTIEEDKIMARIDKKTGKLLPSKMELYTIEESKKATKKYMEQKGYKTIKDVIGEPDSQNKQEKHTSEDERA